ncbi:DEAD/DEAH box helicase [Pseudofrankia sp. BMG5.37]|uniref:DEAD/DEAH box helicase n=1 Tax=Pseudofrankia sp. BMG5.37 TaxID=3050035 RepID=UPI0028953D6D|nr:DEAD/DEAH box helicase [Pseudofrankia sp. BMG5.37]MDT3441477.1 DEAD/DEAH box helicase [Pseudofrankia sp. BMG5.37]
MTVEPEPESGQSGPADAAELLHPVVLHHIVNTLQWPGLRPLQQAAVEPLLAGADALLLAPTAGGKTEATVFPVLSRMAAENWQGTSVLYLCPLKALLNNLAPRLEAYTGWLGRRAAVWHGDVTTSRRDRIRRERPDVLLTTPESLEAMLISVRTDHQDFFAGVRTVIVDEVHAFAGDDRGWHLLAVLERLRRIIARDQAANATGSLPSSPPSSADDRRVPRNAEIIAGDARPEGVGPTMPAGHGQAGPELQVIGLSATVGNPAELLHWLQGSGAGRRRAEVVAPDLAAAPTAVSSTGQLTGPAVKAINASLPAHDARAVVAGSARPMIYSPALPPAPPPGEIELDYVGSVANAAKVLALLHQGEKRLVFCDSKKTVEELGQALRSLGVTTFLSHASLSVDERRRSEEAFAQARDCVIVSTSTLELGIDVGDLDRVVQINAPATVASFLQRLGRTGRRAGTIRNCLFLALSESALVQAAGLLLLWGRGWVEPVVPPPEPRHIIAQQVLAYCLQENRVGDQLWAEEWNGVAPFDRSAEPIVRHLVRMGYLDSDGGMLFVGPEAERKFGHRHFSELTAVFTAAPEFTVLSGRDEIGRTDPVLLTDPVEGPRLLLLAGRSWRVTHIDWKRRRCFVEPADGGGRARWLTSTAGALSFPMTRAMRAVLLGADPPVSLTRRATEHLAAIRDAHLDVVHPAGTMIVRTEDLTDVRWWTWAGERANRTLAATLSDLSDPSQAPTAAYLRLRTDLTPDMWRAATTDADAHICLPLVTDEALSGLKFSTALPPRLAEATLASRMSDLPAATTVLSEPVRFAVLPA